MAKKNASDYKIYDSLTGRLQPVSRLIEKLGIMAVAQKYRVSESTVRKWRRGIHHPAKRTVTKSMRELF